MALRTIFSWHLAKIVNNEKGRQFSTFSLASALKTGITLVLIHDISAFGCRVSFFEVVSAVCLFSIGKIKLWIVKVWKLFLCFPQTNGIVQRSIYLVRFQFIAWEKFATLLRYDLRFIDFRSVLKRVLKQYYTFFEVHWCMMQESAREKLRHFFLTYTTIVSDLCRFDSNEMFLS